MISCCRSSVINTATVIELPCPRNTTVIGFMFPNSCEFSIVGSTSPRNLNTGAVRADLNILARVVEINKLKASCVRRLTKVKSLAVLLSSQLL